MKGRPPGGAVHRRAAPIAIASLAVTVAASAAGCLDRPIAPLQPLTTSTTTIALPSQVVDKIDLLLMIDNSASMADKQAILSTAVPNLVNGIVVPDCLDDTTQVAIANPPVPPLACPTGTTRAFPPVTDIHVGIITSSLGSYGADGCVEDTVNPACSPNPSNALNDQGHLVTRSNECDPAGSGGVMTYKGDGFLAWNPSDSSAEPNITSFTTDLQDLVTGTGQAGCGFEAQNESWYRFLVDPAPSLTALPVDGGQPNFCLVDPAAPNHCQDANLTNLAQNQYATNGAQDAVLLQQRNEFLRPDSLLAIIVLTDETDVSIKQEGYNPVLAQQTGLLPTARTECQTSGPADKCCSSTGLPVPDPSCPAEKYAANPDDNVGIRAFGLTNGTQSLKARYGVDFLYPTSRYVQALTSATLTDANGKSFPNPLLAQRPQNHLFYATVTGVPWQLIARQDANGTPDLLGGVDPLDTTGKTKGGFKTPTELDAKDSMGNVLWDDIVGDPDNYIAPLSPYMQESTMGRSGNDTITGTMISPASASSLAMFNGSLINGHERNITGAPAPGSPPGTADSAKDIQYACIFPRLPPSPQDATATKDTGNGAVFTNDCSSNTAANNNPLCVANMYDNGNPTYQAYAKAYPGVRNLAIVKGMHQAEAAQGLKDTGIVASICAAQLTDATAADYGYKPAVQAIVGALVSALGTECLGSSLSPAPDGTVPCLVLEATAPPAGGQCAMCSTIPGRAQVDTTQSAAIGAAIQQDASVANDCFCVISPATGASLTSCQNDITPASDADGWCYIDATVVPQIGNPKLVQSCPATEQRQVRFVGTGQPAAGSTTFTTCEGGQ